jgi:hypothetical protein
MDSEDDFLSDVTSHEEDEDFDEGTQDSDDGSLGQGRSSIYHDLDPKQL